MVNHPQATGVADARQRHASELGILVAHINAFPEDPQPIIDALVRVLEIASFGPAGQHALIEGLVASKSRNEILAFCNAFTSVLAAHSVGGLIADLQRDAPMHPIHDFHLEGVAA